MSGKLKGKHNHHLRLPYARLLNSRKEKLKIYSLEVRGFVSDFECPDIDGQLNPELGLRQ